MDGVLNVAKKVKDKSATDPQGGDKWISMAGYFYNDWFSSCIKICIDSEKEYKVTTKICASLLNRPVVASCVS